MIRKVSLMLGLGVISIGLSGNITEASTQTKGYLYPSNCDLVEDDIIYTKDYANRHIQLPNLKCNYIVKEMSKGQYKYVKSLVLDMSREKGLKKLGKSRVIDDKGNKVYGTKGYDLDFTSVTDLYGKSKSNTVKMLYVKDKYKATDKELYLRMMSFDYSKLNLKYYEIKNNFKGMKLEDKYVYKRGTDDIKDDEMYLDYPNMYLKFERPNGYWVLKNLSYAKDK